jgi:hypothetical protein
MRYLAAVPLYGWLLALLANIRTGWESMSGTNTLPYFAPSSVMNKRIFRALISLINVIHLVI